MKKITVRAHCFHGWETVVGVPVKIGVIEDLFAATPRITWSQRIHKNLFDITHIPSGFCYAVGAKSPHDAAAAFEAKIKAIGKKKYQKAIMKAMEISSE